MIDTLLSLNDKANVSLIKNAILIKEVNKLDSIFFLYQTLLTPLLTPLRLVTSKVLL